MLLDASHSGRLMNPIALEFALSRLFEHNLCESLPHTVQMCLQIEFIEMVPGTHIYPRSTVRSVCASRPIDLTHFESFVDTQNTASSSQKHRTFLRLEHQVKQVKLPRAPKTRTTRVLAFGSEPILVSSSREEPIKRYWCHSGEYRGCMQGLAQSLSRQNE